MESRSPAVAARARRIGRTVAERWAADVDRNARFPAEVIDALRADELLSVLVPTDQGGGGASLTEVAAAVTALARHCASSAMVYAMHQIQVACLVRHGANPRIQDGLRQLVSDQLLLASATTEAGIGGDVRTSQCAVEHASCGFRLVKQAPVISYGAHADGVLATARRSPDSPPSDQVLVWCQPPGLQLSPRGEWDTLGFRGTCSLGFELVASGDADLILTDPFAEISSQTMLPVSHVLWSAVWLGIAGGAVDRARRFVRGKAREAPGTTPPAALHLAELVAGYEQMSAIVDVAARRYDGSSREDLTGLGSAIAFNALKVAASTQVVDLVTSALRICGMAGYREDSPFSLGRLLRDAHGAALMVNNDRINANTAQMLLVHKDD
jgi:acyl-CoA dehydrogenase